ERSIALLEMTRPIPLDPVPQDQILRTRRRSNGIGLNKSKTPNRHFKGRLREKRLRDGVHAQSRKSRHFNTLKVRPAFVDKTSLDLRRKTRMRKVHRLLKVVGFIPVVL